MVTPYLPGEFPPASEPLNRFLPPIPDGVAAAWLTPRLPPGSWILDPFGTSPRLTVEIARLGYRVLVAANNPIVRFLLDMAANPPPRVEMQTSLAELAAAYRGSERIEPHLRSLYLTECAHCATTVEAEAFLWEHAEGGKTTAPVPYARIYTCPSCRTTGEYPCTPGDISRAAQFSANSIHRARALERVAPHSDPDRPYVEQAINVYLPRAVYVLFTLINKLDGLDLSPERRRHLTALFLLACYQANTLWKHPPDKERRYQLVIPPHFREQNIWLALEQGVNLWSAEGHPDRASPIPIYTWPLSGNQDLPASGIWLFEGRLKSLAESLSSISVGAVCTALPRPNRAFWTLSALWAGWLWGHDAVGPFRSVLRRQRYDWGWHTTALTSSLSHLANILPTHVPVFALLGEFEANYLAAALVAADLAGLQLDSLAIRPELSQAQLHWHRATTSPPPSGLDPEKLAIQATIHYLEARGEPSSFAHSFSAALSGIAQAGYCHSLSQNTGLADDTASDVYAQITAICKDVLAYRYGFLRFNPSIKSRSESTPTQIPPDDSRPPGLGALASAEPPAESLLPGSEKEKTAAELPESGQVWLREAAHAVTSPLSDRIEVALVNYLIKQPGTSLQDIDKVICSAFPGLFTPDTEYLQICLESYAEPDASGYWCLRPQDSPAARRKDLSEAESLIEHLGSRLGFSTQVRPSAITPDGRATQHTFCWVDRYQQVQYWLFPIVSAVIGEIILQSTSPPSKSLIILPGGRSNLVAYKLHHDLRLGRLCEPSSHGWRFLKFRHLRWLDSSPLLSRESLDEQLALDPLTYSTPQLRLL